VSAVTSHDLLSQAAAFKKRLDAARQSASPAWPWYPYDSLANVHHIQQLLGEEAGRQLLDLAGGDPILDIGCGDGDLSFFFETLGFAVDAIDNPVTNHNGMRGIHALKQVLGSAVSINSVDLDEQFRLPRERFSLVCCLGVLYHLKNPYYLLEKLAKSSRYMFLSTRITSWVPGLSDPVAGLPLGYFLRDTELNNDNSNYWIFTEECLLRMLERAHWTVLKQSVKRLTQYSDPTTTANDERMFVLLKSEYGMTRHTLLNGWHAPENEGWRWTEKRFAVHFLAASEARHKCVLKLYLPDELLTESSPFSIEAFAGGESLGKDEYTSSGDYTFSRLLPPGRAADGWKVEFVLNRAIPPDGGDSRERGLIVAKCDLERVS
jgi:tRNA (mo5U34)-methyltransferase